MSESKRETELLVIGAGPGGYASALRAADLGMDVTMVDEETQPGGVCLFRGCIPGKALLYLSDVLQDSRRVHDMGLEFSEPRINVERIREWKGEVINRLAQSLSNLCDRRGIERIRGRAALGGANRAVVEDSEVEEIGFRHAILAPGSRPLSLPDNPFEKGSRIMDSTGALELPDVPERMLIIGGGYIGLEMGMLYASLGSRVTLVEGSDRLMGSADRDLLEPLLRNLERVFEKILFSTTAASLKEDGQGVQVKLEGNGGGKEQKFDRVLVAIGRKPNCEGIGLDNASIRVDEKGNVAVDKKRRTSNGRIFAVGDVTGGPLLAHKAFQEGKVAAEVIKGLPSAFDARAIPAVVYTDPQVAWCGLSEETARQENRDVEVQCYPWKYSGRAVTMGVSDGLTKILIDRGTGRVVGIGIAGKDTEGLISEGVLAIEMGALAEDIGCSIHPHPTLSETLGGAAAMFRGRAIHVPKAAADRSVTVA